MSDYNVEILSIELRDDILFFTISFDISANINDIQFYLSDFEEVIEGKIQANKSNRFIFLVSFRFPDGSKQFNSGVLKTIVKSGNKYINYYNNIYSLKYTESNIDEDDVEQYFDDILTDDIFFDPNERNKENKYDNQLMTNKSDDDKDFLGDIFDFNAFDSLPLDRYTDHNKIRNNVQLNGYSASWFRFSLSKFEYTSNTNNLFFLIDFSYQTEVGTIFDDLHIYITTDNGNIIDSNGYIAFYGKIPSKIDIHFDKVEHQLCLAPTFPININKNDLKNNYTLNICFNDLLEKYKVRKSYLFKNNYWYDVEFLAIPL